MGRKATQTRYAVFFPFQGEEIGGSHVSALHLIEGLDDRWRPIVALHNCEGPLASLLTSRGISFLAAPAARLPGRRRIASAAAGALSPAWSLLKSVRPFAHFLRQNEVDIVHTNDGEMHAAWSIPAWLSGARHVWHHRGDPKARGANLLSPFAASHIVCVSRFSCPSSPILPIRHKLSVIHSPFDHTVQPLDRTAARDAALRELGLPPETRILGYFGALTERKRPLVFVDVIHAFCRRYPEIPVVGLLFGLPGIEDLAAGRAVEVHAREIGIPDRIRLMGYQTPVEPWMCATDVLIVPAVREPFGRTLIEAMLLGTPVVAANSGGNLEAIDDGVTGFLVTPDEPDAFIGTIHRLLADDVLRSSIVQKARNSAVRKYSVQAHVQRISELYLSLLDPGENAGRAFAVSGAEPSA